MSVCIDTHMYNTTYTLTWHNKWHPWPWHWHVTHDPGGLYLSTVGQIQPGPENPDTPPLRSRLYSDDTLFLRVALEVRPWSILVRHSKIDLQNHIHETSLDSTEVLEPKSLSWTHWHMHVQHDIHIDMTWQMTSMTLTLTCDTWPWKPISEHCRPNPARTSKSWYPSPQIQAILK